MSVLYVCEGLRAVTLDDFRPMVRECFIKSLHPEHASKSCAEGFALHYTLNKLRKTGKGTLNNTLNKLWKTGRGTLNNTLNKLRKTGRGTLNNTILINTCHTLPAQDTELSKFKMFYFRPQNAKKITSSRE